MVEISAHLTGRDTSNEVRCRMLAAQGGGERETGRGSEAVVGLLIPANSVVYPRAPARTTEWDE